jgi:two-component system, response regulator PdtaR
MNNDIEDRVSVLIVEDEMMVAMHLAMMVRNLGHEVVGIAVDSKSAALMAEKQPDLAFVDCNLRDGHTGPDVGQQLAATAKSHVIFITANPQKVLESTTPHPSILGVYPKPVNDNEIQQLVSFALAVRKSKDGVSPPPSLRYLTH